MNFHEAEKQYQQLHDQLRAGQISHPEFRNALDELLVSAPDETWWRKRPEDGAWLHWDGSTWIPATADELNQAATAKKKRRWWLTCAIAVFALLCCLGLVAGGGYLALQSRDLTALALSAQFSGYSQVDLANLDDHTLSVDIQRLDVTEDEVFNKILRLDAFDTGSFTNLESGRYQLQFNSESNANLALGCTLSLEANDQVQFVAVPEGIALSIEGRDTASAAELDVATS